MSGGLIHIIFAILILFGIVATLEQGQDFLDEIRNDVCIDIKKEINICFLNETGVRINGKLNNAVLFLESDGNVTECILKNADYKDEIVCQTEFGYIHSLPDFRIKLQKNGLLIGTASKLEVRNLFYKIARNPELLVKNVAKEIPMMLAINGIIYLAEHPELYNTDPT